MKAIRPLPKEVAKVFGPAASDEFIVFINDVFSDQKIDIIQSVSDNFHKQLSQEIAPIQVSIAELRADMSELRTELKTDMSELRTELKTDMAELRTELKTEIAELRTDMANLRTELKTEIADLKAEIKSDITEIHKLLSAQTRWILVVLLAGAVIYPIAIKLIDRLLP